MTRTMVEARGRRRDGEEFYLQAWVSAYVSGSGPRLAAILLDTTEQIRDREEAGLRQLLTNSRIIAGAVSHELRNLAAAAAVLHLNMTRIPGIRTNADYDALGTVIESVQKLSSTELSRLERRCGSRKGSTWLVCCANCSTIIATKFERRLGAARLGDCRGNPSRPGQPFRIAAGVPESRQKRLQCA